MLYTKLEQLPEREAERWGRAVIIDGYPQRQISYDFSIAKGVASATFEQFLEEVNERLARWGLGNYYICEAAQVIADAIPEVDAVGFCKQMERACHDGELILRSNGVPVKPSEFDGPSLFNKMVRRADVNDWLVRIGTGFEMADLNDAERDKPVDLVARPRIRNTWPPEVLRRLLIEASEPGSTHEKLAAKYEVSRQFIGAKLKIAKNNFSPKKATAFDSLVRKPKK